MSTKDRSFIQPCIEEVLPYNARHKLYHTHDVPINTPSGVAFRTGLDDAQDLLLSLVGGTSPFSPFSVAKCSILQYNRTICSRSGQPTFGCDTIFSYTFLKYTFMNSNLLLFLLQLRSVSFIFAV